MAAETSTGNLLNLLQLFTGKGNTETTSGGTSTSQTMLDQGTLNAMLKSALQGNSGLASVAGGQQSAGLYNSTTNSMLTNDLLSRLATQTAVAGAPKVTTTPTTTKAITTPSLGAGGMLGLGAMSFGKDAIDKILKGKNVADATSSVVNSITGSMGESALSGEGFAAPYANAADYSGATMAEFGGGEGASFAGDAMASLLGGGVEDIGSGILSSAAFGGDAAAALGIDYGAATMAEFGAGAGLAAGAGEAGALLGGSELAGGAMAASEGIGLGELVATAAAWVICTELHSQQLLSNELYIAGATKSLTLPQDTLDGYHLWAVPLTRVMRKSKLLTRALLPVALARNKHILGDKNFVGWLTQVIGEPVCNVIGKVARVAKLTVQDWRTLYG